MPRRLHVCVRSGANHLAGCVHHLCRRGSLHPHPSYKDLLTGWRRGPGRILFPRLRKLDGTDRRLVLLFPRLRKLDGTDRRLVLLFPRLRKLDGTDRRLVLLFPRLRKLDGTDRRLVLLFPRLRKLDGTDRRLVLIRVPATGLIGRGREAGAWVVALLRLLLWVVSLPLSLRRSAPTTPSQMGTA